jgi:hypothetical protein
MQPTVCVFGVAPNNPAQPGKQPKSACNAQRVANAIPGATLTGNNTFQGGHEEYGIQVSGADLSGAGFSFYSSPFGNGNGYRSRSALSFDPAAKRAQVVLPKREDPKKRDAFRNT